MIVWVKNILKNCWIFKSHIDYKTYIHIQQFYIPFILGFYIHIIFFSKVEGPPVKIVSKLYLRLIFFANCSQISAHNNTWLVYYVYLQLGFADLEQLTNYFHVCWIFDNRFYILGHTLITSCITVTYIMQHQIATAVYFHCTWVFGCHAIYHPCYRRLWSTRCSTTDWIRIPFEEIGSLS